MEKRVLVKNLEFQQGNLGRRRRLYINTIDDDDLVFK